MRKTGKLNGRNTHACLHKLIRLTMRKTYNEREGESVKEKKKDKGRER
jgi:hypothetical protein